MASEKLAFEFEVRDKASADLKHVEKGFKDVERQLDKAPASMKKVEKSGKGLSTSLGDIKAASLMAVAGITAVAAKVSASVDLYREVQQVVTRYDFTMRNLGATQADMAAQQEIMNDILDRAGWSIDEQQVALQKLAIKIGDADEATRALAIASDLAVASGRDLTAASEAVANAKTGEYEVLKEFGILTKAQIEELNQYEDAGAGAARAMEMLSEKVAGASDEMDPMILKMKQHDAAMGDLNFAIGNFSMALGDAIINLATFGNAADEAGSSIGWIVSTLDESTTGLKALSEALGEENFLGSNLIKRIQYGNTSIETLTASGEELRKTMGNVSDEQVRLTQAITDAIDKYGIQSDEAERAGANLRQYLSAQEESVNSLKAAWSDLSDTMSPFSGGGLFPDYSGHQVSEPKAKVEQKKKKAPSSGPSKKELEQQAAEEAILAMKRSAALAQEEAEKEAARAAELEWRDYVARAELGMMSLRDRSFKAEKAMLLELDRVERDLESGKVTALEAQLQRDQAVATYQQVLEDERRQRDEDRAAREREDHKRRMDEIAREAEAYRDQVEQVSSAGLAISRAIGSSSSSAMVSLGDLTSGITDIANRYALAADQAKASGQAQADAAAAGAQAIAQFASSQGASQRAVNALMAATATAQGFLNISYGNIPGSVAAFTSAAIYGANAIGSGGSSTSAVAPQASAATPGPSKEDAYEGMYQAQLRALRDARDEGKQTVVYNFSGATFLDGNVASQRRVERSLSQASRMTMGVQRG